MHINPIPFKCLTLKSKCLTLKSLTCFPNSGLKMPLSPVDSTMQVGDIYFNKSLTAVEYITDSVSNFEKPHSRAVLPLIRRHKRAQLSTVT